MQQLDWSHVFKLGHRNANKSAYWSAEAISFFSRLPPPTTTPITPHTPSNGGSSAEFFLMKIGWCESSFRPIFFCGKRCRLVPLRTHFFAVFSPPRKKTSFPFFDFLGEHRKQVLPLKNRNKSKKKLSFRWLKCRRVILYETGPGSTTG